MASLLPLLKCPFHQAVLGTTLAAATGLYLLLRPASDPPTTVPSPRTDLAQLNSAEIARLPYPPDLYPGARWVDTPYGVIRVYEWGAETGRKVVFVHGIGMPCCVARDLLWELADAGYRVMTFGSLPPLHFLLRLQLVNAKGVSQICMGADTAIPRSTRPTRRVSTQHRSSAC